MDTASQVDRIAIRQVVEQGFCVGCGACAYTAGTRMELNRFGEYAPVLDELEAAAVSPDDLEMVCPSLRPDLNEDALAERIFPEPPKRDTRIGRHLAAFAAFAKEGDFRERGTSGGMGTWVASELLSRGLVDGVIHVKAQARASGDSPFYRYSISETIEDVRAGARTKYHVVEVSEVLSLLRERDGRFLFIGVPCIVKSLRRLQLADAGLQRKIPYAIALVCGHLKSVNWSLSLAWKAGLAPDAVAAIQYRSKGEGIPARAYVFRATGRDGSTVQLDSALVPGGKFNAGALMLPACDYCDDVVGETADLTIGDAWIPRFEVDERGTNLLVVRNPELLGIIEEAAGQDRIMLEPISSDEAAESQSGGFRQRREGLSYRLAKATADHGWAPVKRVKPGQFALSATRRRIYDLRTEVTVQSRVAFLEALQSGAFEAYENRMQPLLRRARMAELRSSFFRLALNKIKRMLLKTLRHGS